MVGWEGGIGHYHSNIAMKFQLLFHRIHTHMLRTCRIEVLRRNKAAAEASANHGASLVLTHGTTNAHGKLVLDVPRAPVPNI